MKKVILKGGLEKVAFLRDGTAGVKANSCEVVGLRGPACQHSPRTCLGRQMLLPETISTDQHPVPTAPLKEEAECAKYGVMRANLCGIGSSFELLDRVSAFLEV